MRFARDKRPYRTECGRVRASTTFLFRCHLDAAAAAAAAVSPPPPPSCLPRVPQNAAVSHSPQFAGVGGNDNDDGDEMDAQTRKRQQ